MIPKIIHYCWFGGGKKSSRVLKCIKSWYKYCCDFQIIEWNEGNFNVSTAPLFVQQAYAAGKWAYVTDYVRMKVIYEMGGIYLDTDVQVVKSLEPLLNNMVYMGFMSCGKDLRVNSGLGFGAENGSRILKDFMAEYERDCFIKEDGAYNLKTSSYRETEILVKHGLQINGKEQLLDGYIHIYPRTYFCPLDMITYIMSKDINTYTIHWGEMSWVSIDEKRNISKRRRKNVIDYYAHLPNRFLRQYMGDKSYEKLKRMLGRS